MVTIWALDKYIYIFNSYHLSPQTALKMSLTVAAHHVTHMTLAN